MRVVMIGHSLHPRWFGGEPRVARLVHYALREHECDVRILALPPSWAKWRVRSSAYGIDPALKLYEHYLLRIRPDIVVLWYDAVLDSAMHLLELAKTLDYKLIYSVHFHHLWCLSGHFLCLYEKNLTCNRCIRSRLLGRISYRALYIKTFVKKLNKLRELLQQYVEYYKFIVPSRFMAILVQRILRVPKEKVSVIYNGVDLKRFKPVEDKSDSPTILFAGALERHKGFHHYLLLVRKIKECNPRVEALAVGKGSLASLAERYSVKYLGVVSDRELARLYSRAWLVLVPSLWPEPFPLVPLEAASCATLPVAYAVGGLVESCSIVGGITVPRGNLKLLYQTVLNLLEDPSRAKALGELCRKAVQKLSLEEMVKRYVNECLR